MRAPHLDRAGRWLATGLWVVSALLSWHAGPARADEASGRWTGEVEGRGNYYYERSTRVMIPTGRVSLEAPNGVRMKVDYLVDVISTASAASGTAKDNVLTELRHGIGAGVGKLFAVGDNELDLELRAVYSTETDYTAWTYGARGAYSFNQKNTTLSLGLMGLHDTVYRNLSPGVHDPNFGGQPLNGFTTNFGLMQILSPVLVAGLGYQLVYLTGYQGNPYRRALIGPLPHPEAPPAQRVRHNFEGSLSYYLPATLTTLVAFMRFYTDSWDLQAITPEARIYQSIGRDWTLRLRFRYYLQGRAEFALEDGQTAYARDYTGNVTSDPKLRGFHDEQLGLRVAYALTGLAGGPLDFLSRGVLDVSLDHQWNNSTFNNPHVLIGTLGGRLPF